MEDKRYIAPEATAFELTADRPICTISDPLPEEPGDWGDD